MTRGQIHERVVAILARLMEGTRPESLAPDASLRVALAADSMDVLNFVTALHDEMGVEVPEDDYAQLDTLEGCVEYVYGALRRKPGSHSPD
jgi:acyl carrier protein